MNQLYLSPSLHHIRHRKQEGLNPSRYSSSYTSLNSYLKEFHLSEKDFYELRQALRTIFHYTQTKTLINHKQRLTSPYLHQQQLDNDDPLYTNEYFIRNGLLNHNDGPEISDKFSYSNYSKSIIHLPQSSSSVNISLPLALLSNQKYLFTALTSNFASDKCRYSQSDIIKYDDTESMIIRQKKVQAWERNNKSIGEDDQYYRSSIIQTPSTSIDDTTIEDSRSLRTWNKGDEIKNIDHLFPMVKVLGNKRIF
jgi:hypothetical protein